LSLRPLLPAAAVGLALWACATPPPAPEAAATVATVAVGFRAGPDGLVYTALYDLRSPFDAAIRAVAEFQNPNPDGPPLRAERLVPAGERRIALESPVVHEIGNHRPYAVVLTIYRGDGRDDAPIATRRDTARFDVEEAMVPMFIRRGIYVH
jgi:hypothetical protein